MLETAGLAVDDALLEEWRARVERARANLRWPASPGVVRRHRRAASLAFAAPLDQLFTATEINEWALCSAAQQCDPHRWGGVETALRAAAADQGPAPASLDPPTLDEHAAFDRFERLAATERRPDVIALVDAAREQRVLAIVDDHALTLGAGARGRTWPLEALPASASVPWRDVGDVPVVAVTGSNGKTTTVRLIAACVRAHGWRDGLCCTDGVFVANELVERGDYSGPAGTRRVLRDARVEAAVLEMARGGILRRGLAIDRADVALVTNLSNDHFGEYGIDDLEGLGDAKLTVARLVATGGLLVLNADDDMLRRKAASLPGRLAATPAIGWFALDHGHDLLVRHRVAAGATCGVEAGQLLLSWRGAEHDLGAVADMPLTVHAAARYNVANLAGASLAAVALGVDPSTVRQVFADFARNPQDNAGRLMRFDVGGVRVLVDYAHNPDGLRGVLGVAQSLRGHGGRLITLLGHAGNRRDEDIAELARVAAAFAPGLVVVKEDEDHLRGRPAGEVPGILRRTLLEAGVPPVAVTLRMSELEAAHAALDAARPGDAVALLVHSAAAREAVLALLRGRTGH